MPKQNLVNLARHSSNTIVPVPQLVPLFDSDDNPLNDIHELDDCDGLLTDILDKDYIVTIGNPGDDPVKLLLVENTPQMVNRVLTVNSVPVNGETITIAGETYTFVNEPTAPAVLGRYQIERANAGVTTTALALRLANAINGIVDAKVGAGTPEHPYVSASASGATITIKSKAIPTDPYKIHKIGSGLHVGTLSGKITIDDNSGAVGNTMFKWVENDVGYIHLMPGASYDLWLPKWHNIINETGDTVSISIMFLE